MGLAAAAHLISRNVPVKVYEAGDTVAANVRDWAHVRLFSPWSLNADHAAKALLKRHGWQEPPGDTMPTGGDLYEAYLRPLADTPEMRAVIETKATVKAISRQGIGKVVTRGREDRPFSLLVQNGALRMDQARAIIDASGTWQNPNPMGASGFPAVGETAASEFIAYGIPDVLGTAAPLYAGKRVLVVGGGHSAANVLLDLARLAETSSLMELTWALRGENLTRVFGGGAADRLPARGKLGSDLKALSDDKRLKLVTGFAADRVCEANGAVIVARLERNASRAAWPVRPHRGRHRPASRSRHDTGIAPRPRPLARIRPRFSARRSIRTCIPAAACHRMATGNCRIPNPATLRLA